MGPSAPQRALSPQSCAFTGAFAFCLKHSLTCFFQLRFADSWFLSVEVCLSPLLWGCFPQAQKPRGQQGSWSSWAHCPQAFAVSVAEPPAPPFPPRECFPVSFGCFKNGLALSQRPCERGGSAAFILRFVELFRWGTRMSLSLLDNTSQYLFKYCPVCPALLPRATAAPWPLYPVCCSLYLFPCCSPDPFCASVLIFSADISCFL